MSVLTKEDHRVVEKIINRTVPPIVRDATMGLEVLYEEMRHDLRGMAAMLEQSLAQKSTVDDHGQRLTSLEATVSDTRKKSSLTIQNRSSC